MRVFVALVPPPEAVEHLEAFLDVRRDADADLRWSRPEQWHVTLAFAADVRERVLDDLVDGLSEAAGRRPALDLAVAGGGAFPDAASARVLYAGLVAPPGGADDVGEQLQRLSAATRTACARAGAPVDGARFTPHVTLARLGRPRDVTRWVRLLATYEGPAWTAGELHLVRSHLGQGRHGGTRHEPLAALPLA
ncbi:RNA 2',3'-cyclic phosphodiesterase [Angustibacter aerolatus]